MSQKKVKYRLYIVGKVVKFVSIFEEKCRLIKYRKYRDCDLAWEVYKYLYRHKELLDDEEYKSLYDVAEHIIVWHRLGHHLRDNYESIKSFYRLLVTMVDGEESSFTLTESVKKYLFRLKEKHDEMIKRSFIAFLDEKN